MSRYTHGHQESVLRSHRWRTADNSCAYLLPHLHPGISLLDVGCGPATITADLAKRVASVVGIDPSFEVIDAARADYPDLDLRVEGLADHTGSYDVVHAHQVLQHLEDPVGALRRMADLGGLVAVRDSDYPAFVWEPADERLDRWREIYLAVTRHNRADAAAGRRLLAWAHAAELSVVSYSTSTWTFSTPDERAWWSSMWADRCVASSFADQAIEHGLATRGDLAELADGWRAWANEPDGVFIVLHGELLARG